MPLKKPKLKVLVFVSEPYIQSRASLVLLHRHYNDGQPSAWKKRLERREKIVQALRDANVPFTCQFCSKENLDPDLNEHNPRLLTLDHIIPKARGGSNRLDNLAQACHPCNRRKKDTVLTAEQRAKIVTIAEQLGGVQVI